ncbi:MAG TPA: hypothetical protein GXX36_14790 [Clostridiaceae bacterium]|nr:hypothetical protein [Clostridiaceae bacterium]
MSSGFCGGNLAALLSKYIGETVTIFTASGGQSGAGFTGVILSVNDCFVRLITRIGPPPGCSLGNACTGFNVDKYGYGCYGDGYGKHSGQWGSDGGYDGWSGGPILPASKTGAFTAGGWDGYPVATVGSVTDIPIDSIVSFVHNAI